MIHRPSVILFSLKVPEEGEGLIVRLYESAGQSRTVTRRGAAPLASAEAVNLLEETPAVLPVHDGTVTLALRPWEVKTLRIKA